MDNDAIEQVRAYINVQVDVGFLSKKEIVERTVEFFEGTCVREEVQLEAERHTDVAIANHRAAQATWPETTDCDRLDAAFAELEQSGIVARQNATCCQT